MEALIKVLDIWDSDSYNQSAAEGGYVNDVAGPCYLIREADIR